jgi:hypothetical protein
MKERLTRIDGSAVWATSPPKFNRMACLAAVD